MANYMSDMIVASENSKKKRDFHNLYEVYDIKAKIFLS